VRVGRLDSERFEQNELAEQRAAAWIEVERIATGEMADGIRKIQAGAELMAAGFAEFRAGFEHLHQTIPKQPPSWPTFWLTEFLHGYVKQFIGARCEFMQMPESLAFTARKEPDLNARHKEAVQEILGGTSNDKAA
jgi:hypothetical protein